MPFLPYISGAYPVGATTFSLVLSSPEVIGKAKLRDGSPALSLEEVVFTAFYPADLSTPPNAKKPRKGIRWLLSPRRNTIAGYAHFGELPSKSFISISFQNEFALTRDCSHLGLFSWLLWPFMLLYGSRVQVNYIYPASYIPMLSGSARHPYTPMPRCSTQRRLRETLRNPDKINGHSCYSLMAWAAHASPIAKYAVV